MKTNSGPTPALEKPPEMGDIFESGPIAIFVWKDKPDGALERVSQNAERLTGYSSNDFLENRVCFSTLIVEEDREIVARKRKEACTARVEFTQLGDYRIIKRDGTLVWICEHIRFVSNAEGKSSYAISYLTDISERKQVEEQLKYDSQRLSAAIEGSRNGIWDWNAKTNKVYFSSNWKTMLGYREEEIGDGLEEWESRIHPEDRSQVYEDLNRHLQGESPYYENLHRMLCRDGSYKWILDRGRVVESQPDGSPLRVIGTHTDLTEYKAIEVRLATAETEYKTLFDQSPDGILIIDPETGLSLKFNNTAHEQLGYTAEEFAELRIADYEASENEQHIKDRIATLLKTGHDEFETVHRSKDGNLLDIQVTIKTLTIEGRSVLYVLLRDITAQKQVEKANKISQERFALFFTQSLDGIFFMMLDQPVDWNDRVNKDEILEYAFSHQRITEINDAMLHQYLAERESFIGLTPNDFFSHDMDHGKEVWRDFFDHGRLHIETNERRFDDSEMWIEGDYICMYDSLGRITGHFGIQRDVTDRRIAEKNLLESEEKFRQLAENIDQLFWLRTREKMLYVSPAYEKIWGRSQESLYADPGSFVDSIHPEDREQVIEELSRSFFDFDMEYRILRPDGEIRWIWARSYRVSYEHDREIRSAGLAEDVTWRKESQQRLVEALNEADLSRRRAEVANRAKSEFLANMSHEIRTPMNAVLGFSELLNSMVTDSKQKAYLESIQLAGKSLLVLINDILDLSKIEAGRLELRYEPINPITVFEEIERIFLLKVEEKGLGFFIEIEPQLPAGLNLDETRLRQVLLNVVGNAVKFTDAGHVKLSIRKTRYDPAGKHLDLVISVEDTGIGIPEDQQEKIFEAFSQQEGQSDRKYGGTGLGLSISKRLVQMMNGTISVSSRPGSGSTFEITLRDVEISDNMSPAVEEEDSLQFQQISFEPACVLVVDDIESNRGLIRESLSRANLEVIEADNGQKALLFAREKLPQLIFMDIRMPVMDGYQALAELKKTDSVKHIPVIALTASVGREERSRLLDAGFDAYLSKPVGMRTLFKTLLQYLPAKSQAETASGSDPGKPSGKPVFPKGRITVPAELLQNLKGALQQEWETVKDSAIINDIEQFAMKLRESGESFEVEAIRQYGETLRQQAENFEIEKLNRTLASYPAILDSLQVENQQETDPK